ncbi:MAG: UvrD-helicase domain-containing protein [Acidobacteria bacterium]|nr:UvrD-helicase domain-containing protein [Acidobacteriota bacterium]
MSGREARLWDGEVMVGPYGPLNAEQVAAASNRAEPLLLEASAGAGKTLVLVERFVRDVLEGDGEGEPLGCEEILTITFTRKAAAELRSRIRRRFAELAASDIPQAARARAAVAELDGAWISTIDAFCARVLRRHALVAGVDPGFTVIEEADLAGARRRAFADAVTRMLEGPEQERLLDLLAADRYEGLLAEISRTYDRLRSAGQAEPRLPEAAPGEDPDGWIALLDQLLAAYGEAFGREKRRRGGCDFSDVVFATLGLFTDHPAIAAEYRDRFRRVLIDEFQDTNGLQLRLFEALGVPARFQVGDPLQSIYGFRFADVELFREVAEAHDRDGHRLQLVRNYRSRPEILEVLNAAFGEAHTGGGFEWVEIVSGHEDPAEAPWEGAAGEGPFVELLFTDRAAWDDAEPGPAVAEARLVANRVRQLVDDGEAGPGEIVILMETRSAMATYRDELRRIGLEAVSDGGESWWSRAELCDLLVHVRLLANRGDEEQLLGALRSPICGVSLDTLALLGAERVQRKRSSLFEALEAACADEQEPGTPASSIDEAERSRLRAYLALFREWAQAYGGLGAGDLLDRIARDSGYQSLLLQESGGQLALANVRKLVALAHGWDSRDGGDTRAFLDWVDTAAPGSSQTDAPVGGAIDADGRDDPAGPVRLMTIHAAKGLEFPVVVIPRLGSGVRGDNSAIRVEGDRVGCSLHVAGDGGGKGTVGPHAELRDEADARVHHERRRSIHVAVTRAERRLVLSGAGKPSGPWDLDDRSARSAPLRWIVPALLGPDAPAILEEGAGGELPVGGVSGAPTVRLVVSTPDRAPELMGAPEESGALEPGEPEPLRPPVPDGEGAREVPATVSYSELSRFSECGYRWYLEKVVGLPPRAEDGPGNGSGAARARGTLAHRLLEEFTFEEPEAIPSGDQIAALALTVEGASPGPKEIAEQQELLERFAASGLWKEIAACPAVEKESSFAVALAPGDATLPVLTGAIDLIAERPDGSSLVVDYKTDRLDPRGDEDLGERVEARYGLQRDAYALVALRRGASEVEVVYCFLERPGERVASVFTAAHEEQLVARLAAAARELTDGVFPVSRDPRAALCLGCPGRPLANSPGLCSYSFEETSRSG